MNSEKHLAPLGVTPGRSPTVVRRLSSPALSLAPTIPSNGRVSECETWANSFLFQGVVAGAHKPTEHRLFALADADSLRFAGLWLRPERRGSVVCRLRGFFFSLVRNYISPSLCVLETHRAKIQPVEIRLLGQKSACQSMGRCLTFLISIDYKITNQARRHD